MVYFGASWKQITASLFRINLQKCHILHCSPTLQKIGAHNIAATAPRVLRLSTGMQAGCERAFKALLADLA